MPCPAPRFRLSRPPSSHPAVPECLDEPPRTLPSRSPITLERGPRWHLVTLMDAAIVIRDLKPFRQARPVWDRAAETILLAGTTRKRADVAEATRQMMVALERENWVRTNLS